MAGQLLKRKDHWLARVFVGRDASGKRIYVNRKIHGGKREAEATLRDLLSQHGKGLLCAPSRHSVDTYFDEWLRTTAAVEVRANTLSEYTYTLKRYVRPYLGSLSLRKVSAADVRAMVATLLERGLSARTVRKAHEVTRNAFQRAVEHGHMSSNPARESIPLPKKVETDRETVPVAKVQAFIAAAKNDERLGAYWLLLLFGGLRPSEALALRWNDLQGDTVRIQRVLVDHDNVPLHFAPPKSKGSRRAVVLPPVCLDALKAHRKLQAAAQLKAGPAWHDDGLVFPNEVGEPLTQGRTRQSFTTLCKAAALPPMRRYDLRHSAATLLLEVGEDLKVVSERLGHSTITLTADTYSHVTRGMQQRAADKLDKLTRQA